MYFYSVKKRCTASRLLTLMCHSLLVGAKHNNGNLLLWTVWIHPLLNYLVFSKWKCPTWTTSLSLIASWENPKNNSCFSFSFASARKRATLNQLLRRLIALYGNHDISFSGRSAHVRFGAGGKRWRGEKGGKKSHFYVTDSKQLNDGQNFLIRRLVVYTKHFQTYLRLLVICTVTNMF